RGRTVGVLVRCVLVPCTLADTVRVAALQFHLLAQELGEELQLLGGVLAQVGLRLVARLPPGGLGDPKSLVGGFHDDFTAVGRVVPPPGVTGLPESVDGKSERPRFDAREFGELPHGHGAVCDQVADAARIGSVEAKAFTDGLVGHLRGALQLGKGEDETVDELLLRNVDHRGITAFGPVLMPERPFGRTRRAARNGPMIFERGSFYIRSTWASIFRWWPPPHTERLFPPRTYPAPRRKLRRGAGIEEAPVPTVTEGSSEQSRIAGATPHTRGSWKVCRPGPISPAEPPGSSTIPVTPVGTSISHVNRPSSPGQEQANFPWGGPGRAGALVTPPPGRGAKRPRRYPGSSGSIPAMTRCIQSATAPRA